MIGAEREKQARSITILCRKKCEAGMWQSGFILLDVHVFLYFFAQHCNKNIVYSMILQETDA